MKSINMEKPFAFILAAVAICVLSACSHNGTKVEWGSFTSDKTYSYDEAYYALQSAEEAGQQKMIKVTVYSASTDEPVAVFIPARAGDFWGICWESDTYNIWIQSGDLGVLCYTHQDGKWSLDEHAQRPIDIISKYD